VPEGDADGFEAQFQANQKPVDGYARGWEGKTVAVAKAPPARASTPQTLPRSTPDPSPTNTLAPSPSTKQKRLSTGSAHSSPKNSNRLSREVQSSAAPVASAPPRIQVKPGIQKEGYGMRSFKSLLRVAEYLTTTLVVEKQGKGVFHKWETRYLILTSDNFVTYKDRTIETKNIPIAQIRAVDVDYAHQTSSGRVFAVRTSKSYYFRVSSDDEAKGANAWRPAESD